jgi:hypothetical protein
LGIWGAYGWKHCRLENGFPSPWVSTSTHVTMLQWIMYIKPFIGTDVCLREHWSWTMYEGVSWTMVYLYLHHEARIFNVFCRLCAHVQVRYCYGHRTTFGSYVLYSNNCYEIILTIVMKLSLVLIIPCALLVMVILPTFHLPHIRHIQQGTPKWIDPILNHGFVWGFWIPWGRD